MNVYLIFEFKEIRNSKRESRSKRIRNLKKYNRYRID